MVVLYFFIALTAAIFFYRRSVPDVPFKSKLILAILRFISIFIVFLLLFNPVLFFMRKTEIKPRLIFLIDQSDSMQLKHEDQTKAEFLQAKIEYLEKAFQKKQYQVTKKYFANGLEGEPYSTNLTKTLTELAQLQELQNTDSIYLFSDGWLHDEELTIIKNFGIPIHTLQVESQETFFDLEITSLVHNFTAFLNEPTPISISVYAHQYEGKAVVELFDNEKSVAKKEVVFSDNSYQQINFDHSFGYTGLHKIRAFVTAIDEEESYIQNNSKLSAIQVSKEKMKALILTDHLNWDAKFVQKAIRQNPRWEVSFLHQKRNRWQQGNSEVALATHLSKADAVFIIRSGRLSFPTNEVELLKNYCQQGGGLIYQGFPETALRDILPFQGNIITRDFQAKFVITSTGRKYQTTTISADQLEIIPPVRYAYVNPTLQAQILATFLNEESSPAMLYQPYGKGKTLLLPFLDLWKWQMRQSDSTYENFISDMISWISNLGSETFFAATDHLLYRLGETVTLSLTAFDETLSPRFDVAAHVSLKRNGKEVFTDYLVRSDVRYTLSIPNLEAGDYDFIVKDEKTNQETEGSFTISEENPEMYDLGFNPSLLSYLSAETYGNKYSQITDISAQIETAETIIQTKQMELPIYRKWYLIILFILAFCLELFYRKRWGLL